MPTQTGTVLNDIYRERMRQESLVGKKFEWTAASPTVGGDAKLRILVEEVGEVARAIHEAEPTEDLYEELIQVAAIATAWGEALKDELTRA